MCLRLRIIKFYDAIKCRRNRLPCDALVSCDKSNVTHMLRFKNQTGETERGVNSGSIVRLVAAAVVFFDTFASSICCVKDTCAAYELQKLVVWGRRELVNGLHPVVHYISLACC